MAPKVSAIPLRNQRPIWPGAEANHRHVDFQSVEQSLITLTISHLRRLPLSGGLTRLKCMNSGRNHTSPRLTGESSCVKGFNTVERLSFLALS